MSRRKRRKLYSMPTKKQNPKPRARRGRRRLWEKLFVITFTLVTSLFLPLYFQYQSDLDLAPV